MVAAVNRRWQLARRELHVFAPFDHDDELRGNCKILNHLLLTVLLRLGCGCCRTRQFGFRIPVSFEANSRQGRFWEQNGTELGYGMVASA